ncbi:MAG: response regulator [Ignavibacteriales bacterium]|nr:response regulator [Ignavibacteriales bacterium]
MDHKRTILIVDDDPDILSTLEILLVANGYKVFSADNSKTALEIYQREQPDAVATDLMMEEMDSGFMLNYHIKKTAHGRSIPVIMMTAAAHVTGYKFDAYTSDEKEWLKCDALLNKPISVDMLIAKIDSFYEAKK